MIHGRYIGQGEDLAEVRKLRQAVFADGSYDLGEEKDPLALNALVDADGVYVGAGRLFLDLEADRFYVDNLCVLPEYRNKKYGEFTLRMMADKAEQCMAKVLWALVPAEAQGFFEHFFFRKEGMQNGLALMKADLKDFHTCCGHGSSV